MKYNHSHTTKRRKGNVPSTFSTANTHILLNYKTNRPKSNQQICYYEERVPIYSTTEPSVLIIG